MAVRPEQEASKTRVCPGPRNTRKAIFLKQRRERQLESHKNTQAILSILHCGSAALGMRKCRFEDAEVPLWECESAALGMRKCRFECNISLSNDVFCTFGNAFYIFLRDTTMPTPDKNWQKKTAERIPQKVFLVRKECLNSPFYRFNIC